MLQDPAELFITNPEGQVSTFSAMLVFIMNLSIELLVGSMRHFRLLRYLVPIDGSTVFWYIRNLQGHNMLQLVYM